MTAIIDPAALKRIHAAAGNHGLITIDDALDQLIAIGKKPVVSTGIPTLDGAMGFGGLLSGQLYDLCAGTGRGKTSLAGQIAKHHATKGDVLYSFHEAFAGYNVARMAAGPLRVHSNEIIRDVEKHRDAVKLCVPSRIHYQSRSTLAQITDGTKYLSDKSGTPPLVFVDYIQKLAEQIQASQQRPDARLAMSQASAGLLELAEETGATVIAINSISRMSNRRAYDPRKLAPYELVDVAKESGAVEYDAAGMLVLSLSNEFEGDERIATLTVAKARYGTECHIDMRFDGARGSWRDLGRVERDDLRDLVIAGFDLGPVESATAMAKRIKKNKKAVLALFKSMTNEKVIEHRDGLFHLRAS